MRSSSSFFSIVDLFPIARKITHIWTFCGHKSRMVCCRFSSGRTFKTLICRWVKDASLWNRRDLSKIPLIFCICLEYLFQKLTITFIALILLINAAVWLTVLTLLTVMTFVFISNIDIVNRFSSSIGVFLFICHKIINIAIIKSKGHKTSKLLTMFRRCFYALLREPSFIHRIWINFMQIAFSAHFGHLKSSLFYLVINPICRLVTAFRIFFRFVNCVEPISFGSVELNIGAPTGSRF